MRFTPVRTSHVFPHDRRSPDHTRIEFYREEFLRVQEDLDRQRESFSAQAISDMECALNRVLDEIEHLVERHDADGILEAWLRQFVCVTRPDAWSDLRRVH